MQGSNLRNNKKRRFCRLWVLLVLALFAGSVFGVPPNRVDIKALRLAVEDLAQNFPQKYDGFLAQLEGYKNRRAELERLQDGPAKQKLDELDRQIRTFKQQVLIGNPLISGQPIVFVVRPQYKSDHHNTATMFQTGEINTVSFRGGGALKTIDFAAGGKVKTLLELPKGIVRDIEVSFDGDRILFSMREDIRDDYHIYRINADGTALTQLTFGRGVCDIDPIYLPDGDIVFTSTREPKYCMCNRHIMGNLFRMADDGANIHQIDRNTLHSGHSCLLPDGRILYDRWEYVDRNFGDAQGLWSVYPDGTGHAVYWGNNTWSPGGILDARPIPNSQRTICIFSSCHDRPWGALAIIDRRLGVDGIEPVVRTWPAEAVNYMKGQTADSNHYGFDNFTHTNPKYEDPYPLNDKYFLCSRMTGSGEQMGIYLVDIFDNEILLHVEGAGCFDPMPLSKRIRPEAIPAKRDFANENGYLYVVDVYEGTHMKGVRAGAVKYLRVIESPPKPFWTQAAWGGQGVHCPAMNWDSFENKRILGTVPVEADGSAYFEVPSDRFVYFQLLDEKGMMIQSMRSGATVQSGETTGCVGCHDSRLSTPPTAEKIPLALQRAPTKLSGWHGPPRLFNYAKEVQVVFDKNCADCHDHGKEAAEKLNLAADRTITFNTSYNELWRKKYIKSIGAGPATIQPAYSWGSHKSKLVQVILDGHEGVELDAESFDRIVTWIDINGPYYPSYASAYPDNLTGRCPLDNDQIRRLSELTGVPFDSLANRGSNQGPQISFDRPELSPALLRFDKKEDLDYLEALAIIQAGKERLIQRQRADMAGFIACPVDQQRQEKYTKRQRIEQQNRKAIRNGQKAYDIKQGDL